MELGLESHMLMHNFEFCNFLSEDYMLSVQISEYMYSIFPCRPQWS